MATATRVMVADGRDIVCAGVRQVLLDVPDFDAVGEVATVDDLFVHFDQKRPKICIIQENLPAAGGLMAATQLSNKPGAPTIVLVCDNWSRMTLRRAAKHGVHAVVPLSVSRDHLISQLRQLRLAPRANCINDSELLVPEVRREEVLEIDRVNQLSSREFEVFKRLSLGESVSQIASNLNLSPKTVGHHYTRVKSKLATANLASMTRLAIRLNVVSV